MKIFDYLLIVATILALLACGVVIYIMLTASRIEVKPILPRGQMNWNGTLWQPQVTAVWHRVVVPDCKHFNDLICIH